jgi:hypothetical protein
MPAAAPKAMGLISRAEAGVASKKSKPAAPKSMGLISGACRMS